MNGLDDGRRREGREIFFVLAKTTIIPVLCISNGNIFDKVDHEMQQHEFRVSSVFALTSNSTLLLFKEMWIAVFMWCFVSSVFLYSIAALVAFSMLRRHKLGKFYSVMILVMGTIIPCSLGLLSSAAIAFVYKHSSFSMFPTHAMMWGVGQTVIHAAVGVTRVLATL